MRGRPSIVFQAYTRIDSVKSIGQSRHAAKKRLAVARTGDSGYRPLAPSTGRIHSDKTRSTYRGIALRYVQWARSTLGIMHLADLDADADYYVSLYLETRRAAGDSAYTLKTIRSALRLFHGPAFDPDERAERVRQLGAGVALPVRRREEITRSRRPVAMDRQIALERYASILAFARATGLRRRELEAVRVGDVRAGRDGAIIVDVSNGKGGKRRSVPVLSGHEDDVLDVIIGREPDEVIFERVPVRIDVAAIRACYARALYCENGARLLPSPEGRLPRGSVDVARAGVVAQALGHSPLRIDTVVRHYLR